MALLRIRNFFFCLLVATIYSCYGVQSIPVLGGKNTLVIKYYYHLDIGPRREKTCHRGFANSTGADQPAHPRSLISAFVIRFEESTICRLATDEISIF